MQPRPLIVIVGGLALAVVGARMAQAGGKADHLICYKMADSVQIAAAVDMIADLQPEFSQRDCRLLKPIEFCVPATKQNVTPQPNVPDLVGQPLRQDYICYLAKCAASLVPPAKKVADQFGVRIEQKYKPTKVCVPAAKLPVRCGETGAPQCGGVCPAGQTCKQGTAGTSQCTCQPLPCGEQPDKGGACGGSCPGGQACQLLNSTSGKPICGCTQQPPPPCGTNPLTGSCGGACSDPTKTCQTDAAGNCTCGGIPPNLCGQTTAGVCGGTCPNPTDSCVPGTITGQLCTCVPAPCHQDPVTGQCSGSCATTGASPGTCHLSGNACVCGPPPCSIDPASGQCGGPCPNGGTCAPDSANNCTCLQQCGFDATTNACGGACPIGTTCQVIQGACRCNPATPCGPNAETAGVCSGACQQPGEVCRTIKTASAGLQCMCLNN